MAVFRRILGIVINLHLVRTGHAHHYSYFDKTAEYASAEAEAQQKKLGLWQGENPVTPYNWRRAKRRM